MKKTRGFTLIEMSMVLVFIALMAGGIVISREAVLGWQIRKTVEESHQYINAFNMFKDKYGCYPGDCIYGVAYTQFGMPWFDGTGAGDGDGNIGLCCAWPYFREAINTFPQMAWAGLIPQGNYPVQYSTVLGSSTPKPPLPLYDVNGGGSGWLFQNAGTVHIPYTINYLMLAHFNQNVTSGGAIHPAVAYEIDKKIDDGKPYSGKMKNHAPLYYTVYFDHGWVDWSGTGNECARHIAGNYNIYNVEAKLASSDYSYACKIGIEIR